MKRNWIYKPFNPVSVVLASFFVALLTVSTLLVRPLDLSMRKGIYTAVCLVTFVCFFIYKRDLSRDKEYDRIVGNMGGFNWWGELPLQLCNINMMIMPIGVWLDHRGLMGFAFFAGTLGASIALSMPANGFSGYSIFLPRMVGYLFNHYMIVMEAIALVTFGFYSPEFSDIPVIMISFFLISCGIYLINLQLRKTGLHPHANYFYINETEGNPVMELFYKFIPVPFWYALPCLLVLLVYMLVIIGGFSLFRSILR